VTHLRKMMLEELQRRNYTESTTRAYCESSRTWRAISTVHPINRSGHIRELHGPPLRDRKLSDNTVNQRVGALVSFREMFERPWPPRILSYPKKRFHLPGHLESEEVRSDRRAPSLSTGPSHDPLWHRVRRAECAA